MEIKLNLDNFSQSALEGLLRWLHENDINGAHWSDCAEHNEPAYPNEPCNCMSPEFSGHVKELYQDIETWATLKGWSGPAFFYQTKINGSYINDGITKEEISLGYVLRDGHRYDVVQTNLLFSKPSFADYSKLLDTLDWCKNCGPVDITTTGMPSRCVHCRSIVD